MKKENHYIKKLLGDYNSVSGYISREQRSEKLKEYFNLGHGKHKSKKRKGVNN